MINLLGLGGEKLPPGFLPVAVFNAGIEKYLGGPLVDLGFEKVKDNLWVQDLGSGVRKIVQIRSWKGDKYTPWWGYSLDYVPHFDNSFRNIYWHRTDKSARFDIVPLHFNFSQYEVFNFALPKEYISRLRAISVSLIKDMNDFYALGSETANLVKVLEKCESSSPRKFWGYIPLPLAYAFTLNKLGNTVKARQVLDRYINRFKVSAEVCIKLIERFDSVGIKNDG